MQLIPVIDLMAGQVVRGVRGERSAYRPIRSPLCESSAPLDLAPRLLERAASDTLYIADNFAGNGVVERINALIEQRCALTIRRLTDPAAESEAAAKRHP